MVKPSVINTGVALDIEHSHLHDSAPGVSYRSQITYAYVIPCKCQEVSAYSLKSVYWALATYTDNEKQDGVTTFSVAPEIKCTTTFICDGMGLAIFLRYQLV
jgi:hypothetical protein